MAGNRTEAVEDFLVEHVMLGLGNIRTALNRIGPDADPEVRALALRRIEGRIDDIEIRARALLDASGRARQAAPPAPAAPATFTSRRRAN